MSNVVVHGAAGRMGLSLIRVIRERADLTLAGAIDRAENAGKDVGTLAGGEALGVSITTDLDAALDKADVVIDFTHPSAVAPLYERIAATKTALVIGTTGFDAAGVSRIQALGESAPVVYAPNYSQGVTLLFHLAARAAKALHEGFDAEIVEMHHHLKVDSPSGTAVKLAEVVAEARGLDPEKAVLHGRSGQVGARTKDEIGVLALRGGDVVGEHTLFLQGLGERVELTHRATDRMIFARGAMRAAAWVVGKPNSVYDMFDMMGVPR
jgi:4-hydroxy-tetrahydrodipicolinate reductase